MQVVKYIMLLIVAYNVNESELELSVMETPDYSVVHDKVVSICPQEGTVTLSLTQGLALLVQYCI